MWLLDRIIAIFSPLMGDTLELQKLNRLWERFNKGENVLEEIKKHSWKYHWKNPI